MKIRTKKTAYHSKLFIHSYFYTNQLQNEVGFYENYYF